MKTVVELKNVTKKIGSRTIIDRLSFRVFEGEVFGFLGPNGAGKTTTIRMMVGLMGITAGEIRICGSNIQKEFEKAIRNVGAIVENPEMYKFLSGYENLHHYARMTGGVTKEKIDNIVQLVGLSGRIHDKVKRYSLGMRQRLGIAQALLHDPKVLILDEPLNGLDPAGIREMRDYMRQLAKEKRMAIIVSSHQLSEMELMCDRIGIIDKGKLINIQKVHDDGKTGTEKLYALEVGEVDIAMSVIQKASSVHFIQKDEKTVIFRTRKKHIPALIQTLVQKKVRIYGVKEVTRTLEDRFLEVTAKKGDQNLV